MLPSYYCYLVLDSFKQDAHFLGRTYPKCSEKEYTENLCCSHFEAPNNAQMAKVKALISFNILEKDDVCKVVRYFDELSRRSPLVSVIKFTLKDLLMIRLMGCENNLTLKCKADQAAEFI